MRALLSLAIGSFGIGMTEFVAMGLLPNIAQDLLPELWAQNPDEAIGRAGILVSLYALGVVLGAPTIAGLVARFPRHRVMVGLAIALTLGNGLAVVLPTFETVGLARFIAGLPHGAYFGIGALVASDVLGPGKRAKGVAFILTGLTIANVVGVPAGTFLGQHVGWRSAFLVVTIVFALATVCIALFVPQHAGDPERTFRAELRVFRRPQVWFALATGAIGFGGFFAVYSYIAPVVTERAGAPEWMVPITLVVFGLGMTIGNLLGGVFGDRNLRLTLLVGLAAMAVVLVLLAVLSFSIWLLVPLSFVMALLSSILSPAIQTRLMEVAGDNQSIAAALNHSALNIGNSLGAFLGGLVIAWGWGFAAPSWVGAGLAVLGLGIALASYAVQRRYHTETGSVRVRDLA
ncbi:Inner membrane transport protein YdhP [Microbacterium azadirachtae]|uniref:Inner membrane transport protein YdhP n=2 Tax=Microbacterium azadirachtae TaxID=582680 RepID=A0A0F0L262_9MICO|nr:Inner membrane transport protein YdhP [Microbacterium azadirachtae]SDM49095.1 MFS transporter, DHA1 family, arabinose polymer transporter [Microbacterium azadirachtae]SEG59356.1 MFS transporter, DHA1 family, arabinose polymer transporter [Microbacterium azadirachtae]SEG62258.1 MFS transporter, DHA1 family, arabinose polymer transporter [Microbacterium azadirachtae]